MNLIAQLEQEEISRLGKQIPARDHEVAHRDFLVHHGVKETLVDGLVAAAQEDGTVGSGHGLSTCLREMLALRGQIDDGQLGAPFGSTGLAQHRQAAQQRLGQHHHARPTAIGTVIDAPVIVEGVVARIPAAQEIRFVARAPDHAIRSRGLDQVGKDGDDLEVHGNERRQGMRRPSLSPRTAACRSNVQAMRGISASRPPNLPGCAGLQCPPIERWPRRRG